MPDTSPYAQRLQAVIPAAAATADTEIDVVDAPFAATVSAVKYVAAAAITGAASPASRTFVLVNKKQDGTGTTVVATLAMVGGVNAAADDELTITLSSTASDLVVAAGDVLAFQSNHVGATGLADPGGLAVVELTRS